MTNDFLGPQMFPCISESASPSWRSARDGFQGLGITLSNQIHLDLNLGATIETLQARMTRQTHPPLPEHYCAQCSTYSAPMDGQSELLIIFPLRSSQLFQSRYTRNDAQKKLWIKLRGANCS